MSIQILTVRQFMEIFLVFGIYSVMTLLLPAVLLYQNVRSMRFSARFLIYQTVGNFYIMYLVMALRMFRVCGRFTLSIFALLPFLVWLIYVRVRPMVFKEQGKQRQTAGSLTIRYADRIWLRLGEILMLFITAAVILAAYDGNAVGHHSYNMTDLTEYNSWIYEMGNSQTAGGGKLLGFYSIIYFLHTVFGLDDFMLFRAFWIVQTILLYFTLLAFLRLFCTFKYTAYIGTGIYMLAVFFGKYSMIHSVSVQLQEFGMIFVLASAAFLFLFFERKKQELEEEIVQKAGEEADDDEEEARQQVFLLDEVLARSAEREAYQAEQEYQTEQEYQENQMETDGAAGRKQEAARQEVVLIMEENAEDGTISIKECPLDGTISIKDTSVSIDEVAEHASEDIPLADTGVRQGAEKDRRKYRGRMQREFQKDSAKYLVFFVLAFGMTLSVSAVQAAIAGVFFAAVCMGYCFRLFRIPYLWRIVLAGCTALSFPAAVMLSGNGGMLSRDIFDLAVVSESGHLTRRMVRSMLFHAGGSWQSMLVLLSVGLLIVLAVCFFVMGRTDYGARMLSIALYRVGLTLLIVFFGPGMLDLKTELECIRLYEMYAFVIVWGLCVDGILRLLNGCLQRLKNRRLF